MRSATAPVQVNGTNVWRKVVLALCASLVGVALAYTASPPGTSITRRNSLPTELPTKAKSITPSRTACSSRIQRRSE